jgi:hypothetical protein
MPTAPKRLACRHIHTAGNRCGSPSLRGEDFCYYHHITRRPAPKTEPSPDRDPYLVPSRVRFVLPSIDDRASIQQAIYEVLRRIAADEIDPRRAGLLLYGLQTASSNLPKPEAEPQQNQSVEEVIEDPTHGPLAPIAEFRSKPHEKSLEQILLEQWENDAIQRGAKVLDPVPHDRSTLSEAEGEELSWGCAPHPNPIILPDLNATEEPQRGPVPPSGPEARPIPALGVAQGCIRRSVRGLKARPIGPRYQCKATTKAP